MKRVIISLGLFFLVINTFSQSEYLIENTKWISEHKMLKRMDTLHFKSQNNFTHFDSETSWHFDGKYKIDGDTIILEIILQQFEVDDYLDLEPTAFWKLINYGEYMDLIYLAHKRNGKIEEISEESYKMIENYKKNKKD